jgi:hypothetical protein
MYIRAKEKFMRLHRTVFMSLDIFAYLSELDRALAWLLTVKDPREIEPPEIVPPTIRLLDEITEFE